MKYFKKKKSFFMDVVNILNIYSFVFGKILIFHTKDLRKMIFSILENLVSNIS